MVGHFVLICQQNEVADLTENTDGYINSDHG